MISPILFTGLLLDRLAGEPPRLHPLVGFGSLASRLEGRMHAPSRLRGALAAGLMLLPPLLAVAVIEAAAPVATGVISVWLAVGWRSLDQHAIRVRRALEADDPEGARKAVGRMVSRETDRLDAGRVAGAAVESVLENGNDALFGVLFWYAVAGSPGAVAYRLANTLDAMWGYRNPRYRRFGWAAARLDDLLNLVPARLTALGYALGGSTRAALACWRRQAGRWKSPNAGVVMAAGAGALGLRLGGTAVYGGMVQRRPPLGLGRRPEARDIDRARGLVARTAVLWMLLFGTGEWMVGHVR